MSVSLDLRNVADYICEFLAELRCFKIHGLMGGGAAGLNDGFIRNPKIQYYCYHHEQSAGYAALGEARLTKSWAIINPTTGCGGTNCYTPVLNAWQDSIPLIIISGNVNLETCTSYLEAEHGLQLRAYGVQEHNIVQSIEKITKYSKVVEKADQIESAMIEAFFTSASGRKGPAWIDVPADVQHQNVPAELIDRIPSIIKLLFSRLAEANELASHEDVSKLIFKALQSASRPLVLIGGGVTNDLHEKRAVQNFIYERNLPVAATYAATDVIDHGYEMYLGAVGIKGNRAGNFAVQNCDLLIVLGSRLPFAAIGYDVQNFAGNANILVVDIDKEELKKNQLNFENRLHQIQSTAGEFIAQIKGTSISVCDSWKQRCKDTKSKWDIIEENKTHYNYEGISIYHVMEELNKNYYDNCNFVADAGSISYVAPTALAYNETRSFIFSPAQADMGCALPSSLGVSAASEKRTICITGDGSFMSNLQELATFKFNKYRLTVIILNNSGYLSISNTQKNNYGDNRIYGEHQGRGLHFPDYKKLCDGFNLSHALVEDVNQLSIIRDCDFDVVEVRCLISETIAPYQARINGRQAGAHDMAPFRDKDELISLASVNLNFER